MYVMYEFVKLPVSKTLKTDHSVSLFCATKCPLLLEERKFLVTASVPIPRDPTLRDRLDQSVKEFPKIATRCGKDRPDYFDVYIVKLGELCSVWQIQFLQRIRHYYKFILPIFKQDPIFRYSIHKAIKDATELIQMVQKNGSMLEFMGFHVDQIEKSLMKLRERYNSLRVRRKCGEEVLNDEIGAVLEEIMHYEKCKEHLKIFHIAVTEVYTKKIKEILENCPDTQKK